MHQLNQIIVTLTQAAQAVPEGRVFGFDTQMLFQIGIQVLNGLILAVALTYILYKPVKAFLQKRSEGIQNEISTAEATQQRADALIKEYEAKIAEIEQERLEIVANAEQQAEKSARDIIDEARKEADALKQRELESVREEEKRMYEEVRLHVIDLSSVIAERYLAQELDDASRERYSAKVLAQLEETGWPS